MLADVQMVKESLSLTRHGESVRRTTETKGSLSESTSRGWGGEGLTR